MLHYRGGVLAQKAVLIEGIAQRTPGQPLVIWRIPQGQAVAQRTLVCQREQVRMVGRGQGRGVQGHTDFPQKNYVLSDVTGPVCPPQYAWTSWISPNFLVLIAFYA